MADGLVMRKRVDALSASELAAAAGGQVGGGYGSGEACGVRRGDITVTVVPVITGLTEQTDTENVFKHDLRPRIIAYEMETA